MQKFENDIHQCLAVLKNGGLILYPTDTIWGIGCNATNEEAVKKIYELKKRSDEKSMIILVADEKEVLQYADVRDTNLFEYLKKNPKPTTVIYPGAKNLAANLIGKLNTIAIRICRDDFCKQLIRSFGKPVVSTSANISGITPPKTFTDINEEIKKGVDHIVRYRQDENKPFSPSMIIRWESGRPIIIRE